MNFLTAARLSILTAVSLLSLTATADAADDDGQRRLERAVNEVIHPLMRDNGVPGMAVALTVQGKRYVFQYGVASRESGQKVTPDTIFEIGSISKAFTATLGAHAHETGSLSLFDRAGTLLPALAGSSVGAISLLELATYTAGGFPLQFPESVTDQETMMSYYRNWRPDFPAGTRRLYSNPSIGLFGHLVAARSGEPFDTLMERMVFPAFGLKNTFLSVPPQRMRDYAFGYSRSDKPVRVNPDVLAAEAYGVKTTASDLLRFVEANMNGTALSGPYRRAVHVTQTGYYKTGDMTQGLGWEMYTYPITLDRLTQGNSAEMLLEAQEATRIDPPLPPRPDRLVNKTGSTQGFSAYVLFVPGRSLGIVMLANKNYPIPARVKAAYQILTVLDNGLTTANTSSSGSPSRPGAQR
jgi:beta-lactamase class C